MLKKILVGILFVIAGAAICFAVIFSAVYKREITPVQAQELSQEYLELAAENFEVFSKKLKFALFEPEKLRSELKAKGFAQPHEVRVANTENKILIGGLDEASISEVTGSFLCNDSTEAKDFRIRLIYDKSRKEWLVMDFVVESCL